MRIYSAQYAQIARDVVRALQTRELIDVDAANTDEAELDVVGVLREYNRMSRQINDMARDLAGPDGRANEMRIRRRLAREKDFVIGEDALEYVVNQIIEALVQSTHIEEVYGSDRELRAVVTPIVDRHTQDRENELDAAVRSRIKNLAEGSASWDIEYERVMQQVRRNKGLADD